MTPARSNSRAERLSVDVTLVAAVLSRMMMGEETIPERIAYAHEPRKLTVMHSVEGVVGCFRQQEDHRRFVVPAVARKVQPQNCSTTCIGSGIVATLSRRARSLNRVPAL